MKKLLHKLRMWLLYLLRGNAQESRDSAFEAAQDYIHVLNLEIAAYEDEIRDYKKVVREICRRSDNSYYDWCCEYCDTPCTKCNGWCGHFAPKDMNHG